MASINMRLTDQEKNIISKVASFYDLSISAFVKQAIFEKIEDELDIKLADESYQEYLKDPKVYTLDEIKKELDI